MFSKVIDWLFSADSNLPTHVDQTSTDRIDQTHMYLDDLCTLLPDGPTFNDWRIHFYKMQRVLQQHVSRVGIDQVTIMWNSIHDGIGRWNDDYIPHEDENTVREINIHMFTFSSLLNT